MLAISSESQNPNSSALCALRSALCALRSALCALRSALCALRLYSVCHQSNGLSWLRSVPFAIILPLILVSGCGPRAGLADHRPSNSAANLPPTLLQPSIARIDLGSIARGGNGETTVWLCNNGTRTVEIAEINTSCECFQVMLEKKIIRPGERTQARIRVDFAHEPTFTGHLGLRAEGVTKTREELAFVLLVDVMVK